MWLAIINIIISKIPSKYFIKSIVRFYEGVKHNPILTILILFAFYKLIPLINSHKNATFIQSVKVLEIEKEVSNALNHLGNGSTIAGISIGEEYFLDDKISFTTDFVTSCDKNFPGYIKFGKCDIDVKWMNPAWRKVHEIDKRSLEALNKDEIKLGKFSIIFKDEIPLCLNIYNEDYTLSQTGILLKEYVPDLFTILESSKRTVEDICIVRIRHPLYKNIVYVFTAASWQNDYGRPEMKFEKDRVKILQRLARIKKRQLL